MTARNFVNDSGKSCLYGYKHESASEAWKINNYIQMNQPTRYSN